MALLDRWRYFAGAAAPLRRAVLFRVARCFDPYFAMVSATRYAPARYLHSFAAPYAAAAAAPPRLFYVARYARWPEMRHEHADADAAKSDESAAMRKRVHMLR